MKFIIARYNEDIQWTTRLFNCIIYNKRHNIINTLHPVISLPNVGREGHTYLYYIIHNYDSLDDYTVFLQGNPFDHSPFLIQDIHKLINDIYTHRIHIPYCTFSKNIYRITAHYDECENKYGHPSIQEIYPILFGKKRDSRSFLFGAGAQFIVSKQTILSRPKQFYETILKLLDHSVSPIEGYGIERMWSIIFTHGE